MACRLVSLILLVFFLALPISVSAQENTSATPDAQPVATGADTADEHTEQYIDPASWTRVLDTTEQALSREGVTDGDLDHLFDEITALRDAASKQAGELKGSVERLRQQLDELGKPPAEGEPEESAEAKKLRDTLSQDFADADAHLKRTENAEIRARQLQKAIADLRYTRFIQSISVRTPDLFSPGYWGEVITGFHGFSRGLYLLVSDSLSIFAKRLGEDTRKQILLPFLLLGLFYLAIRARRMLSELIDNDKAMLIVSKAGAATSGLIYYLKDGIILGLVPVAIYWVLSGLDLLTIRLDVLLKDVAIAVGFVIAVTTLLNVYLAPGNAEKRVSPLGDAAATRIFSVISTSVLVAVSLFILNRLTVVLVSPLEVSVGLSLIFALIVGGTSLWALFEIRKDRRRRLREKDSTGLQTDFWSYLIWVFWIATLMILVSAIVGFVAFAEFLSQQLLFGMVVILSARLLLRFVDHVFTHVSAESIARLSDAQAAAGDVPTSGQALILGAGIVKLAVYCAAGILLLLPWGYRTADFYEVFKELFFGFEVGGLTISFSTLLFAVLLFFVGYTITVALRSWLNNKFLPTTQLDIGVSNSISTVFGYVGFILAAILAVTAAGFDLSSLAIVAGALSLGVGFGLQSIVNNFVSGLILLAERPIKSGDWIVTAGGEGYVKKISVRSTEIETFDQATVIVPNSSLITDTVTNWTHGSTSGRIILPVGVGYDSDPDQVEQILLSCVEDNKMILKRPQPVVYFVDFGASSLDFQLRCYLRDINYSMSVKSELRFNILRELRKANIEIPYPQRDVHIRSQTAAVEKPAPRSTGSRKTTRKQHRKDSE